MNTMLVIAALIFGLGLIGASVACLMVAIALDCCFCPDEDND